MKEYIKPEVEFVSRVAKEEITSSNILDGEMDTESSIF